MTSAPRRKIDYGAPYDPRNRPVTTWSAAPAAAAAAPAPRRKIDYGAPYDPRNRPVTTASAAPAAADAPAWSAAPAAAAAPAPVGRKIDYGAPYDPRNRGGSDTLARVEATLRTRWSRPTVALLPLQSAARSTMALRDTFLPAVDRLRAGDRRIVCIRPRDCCSLAKCEGLNSTHFSRLVTWSVRARMAVSATPRSHDELYFFFGD